MQNFDVTAQKQFLVHVLTQILPASNIFTQNGNEWRISKTLPGLESFSNQGFRSMDQAIDAIASYYVDRVAAGNVSSLTSYFEQSGRRAG